MKREKGSSYAAGVAHAEEKPGNRRDNHPQSAQRKDVKRWREISSRTSIDAMVNISLLRYSQLSCSDHFQCGRPLMNLVQDLLDAKVTLSEPFLRLTVFDTIDPKTNERILRCIDNRRLFALKEFAEISGKQRMMVHVKLHDLNTCTVKMVQRFIWNSDATPGLTINLRVAEKRKKRRRNRSWILSRNFHAIFMRNLTWKNRMAVQCTPTFHRF